MTYHCTEAFMELWNDEDWWAKSGRDRLGSIDLASRPAAYMLTGYELWCLYLDINLPLYVFHHLLSSLVMYVAYTVHMEKSNLLYIWITAFSNAIFNWFYLFNENKCVKEAYPNMFLLVGVIFSASFFLFRIIAWFYVTYIFVLDFSLVAMEGVRDDLFWGATLCAACNVYVSFSQAMWMKQIVNKLRRMFFGKSK